VKSVERIPGVWRKGCSCRRKFGIRSWIEILRETCVGAVIEVGAMLAELGTSTCKLHFAKLQTPQCAESQRTTIILEQEPPKIAKMIMNRLPLREMSTLQFQTLN
jgi:hypothetical protein